MPRITDVRAVQPDLDRAPPDWRRWFGQVAIRVDTDDGLAGYGVSGGGVATTTAVNALFREALLGLETTDPDSIWRTMHSVSSRYGRSGLSIMAMSGVDLAVWDINARAQKTSMANFLGGAKISRIPGYVTDPESLSEACTPGITGVKIAVRKRATPESVVQQVQQARAALGDGFRIMVDVGTQWDFETASSFSRQVADYDLAWLEEPLPPEDIEGYRRLRQICEVPIAGGEHCYTAAEFRHFLEAEALDIVQPDITWCGGMTTLVEVYRMGEQFGVHVCPHRGGDVWSLPAIAALGSYPLAEQARRWTPELNGPFELDAMGYKIPDGYGFGTEIDLFQQEAGR
jgi:L-alanine-DL-glutamate epimerase-like enolase superfamily enzyme